MNFMNFFYYSQRVFIFYSLKIVFIFLVVMSLSALASESKKTIETEYCLPYSEIDKARLLTIEVNAEKEFSPYVITVKDEADGRRQVNIISDHLIWSKETFGALVTTPQMADKTISSINIDARKITIEDSITLINGSVNIYADEVIFNSGGVFHLHYGPQAKMKIYTNKLFFLKDSFYPFDYRISLNPKDFPDKILIINASEIFFGNDRAEEDKLKKQVNYLFSFSSQFDFSPYIDIVTGPDAKKNWIAEADKHYWPEYTTSQWESLFRISPFSLLSNAKLTEEIKELSPQLVEMGAIRALHTTHMIETSIQMHTDLDGNGAALAPIQPLSYWRKEIAKYETKQSQGAIRLLELIDSLNKLGEKKTPEDFTNIVRNKSDELQKLKERIDKSGDRVTELSQLLSSKNETLQLLQQAYHNREEVLLNAADQRQKDAKDRQAIISGISTVVSIVVTAYTGNPATGSAAGGIIYGLADHNENPNKNVITSLAAGYQFAQKIAGPLDAASKSFKALDSALREYNEFCRKPCSMNNITIEESISVSRPDPKNPGNNKIENISRKAALDDFSKKSNTANESISNIYNVYNTFKEESPKLSADLEDDKSLKEISVSILDALNEIKMIVIELESLNRELQESGNKQAKLFEDIAKLTFIQIGNAEETQAKVLFLLEAIEKEFTTFINLIQSLQRVSLYEYLEPLPISQRILKDLILNNKLTHANDREKWKDIKDEKKLINAYVKFSEERLDTMIDLAKVVVQASREQFNRFVNMRGFKPVISTIRFNYFSDDNSPNSGKAFIEQINDTLNEQYQARNDSLLFDQLSKRMIAVPYKLNKFKVADINYPVRFIDARISQVELQKQLNNASEIHFQLEVGKVGNLRTLDSSNSCYSIDFRSKNTPPKNYNIPFHFTLSDIIKNTGFTLLENLNNFWWLDPDEDPSGNSKYIAYPAAESRGYLKVWFDPDLIRDNEAPLIKSLAVEMRVYQ